MDELKETGQFLTIVVLAILYVFGWMMTITWIKKESDKIYVKVIGMAWLMSHVTLFILFLIWSWL